jgi:hypothetical protein
MFLALRLAHGGARQAGRVMRADGARVDDLVGIARSLAGNAGRGAEPEVLSDRVESALSPELLGRCKNVDRWSHQQ